MGRDGFKPSQLRAHEELAPIPTNLMLSALEVRTEARGGATIVHPTVTLGAPAAHTLGFGAGGAEAISADLASVVTERRREKVPPSVPLAPEALARLRGYVRRCALLKCHIYTAVAASFDSWSFESLHKMKGIDFL